MGPSYHPDFCTDDICDKCHPGARTERLVQRAEKLAKDINKTKSLLDAGKLWESVKNDLRCCLCERTPETWTPPKRTGRISYQWCERQYGQKAVTFCPSCTTGSWIAYSPTEWKFTEPKFRMLCSQETYNWMNNRDELVKAKLPHVKKEDDFKEVNEVKILRVLKRKGYKVSDDEESKLTNCENIPPKRRPNHPSPAHFARNHKAIRDFTTDYNKRATIYKKRFGEEEER